jgi:cytochrome c peroxidase
MKFTIFTLFFITSLLNLWTDNHSIFSTTELDIIKTLSPLPEIPADPTNQVGLNPKAADMGSELFNDWRLSRGEEFACQTCHRISDDFMSVRLDTPKDIPSLWNIAYNNWFFWDGRADTLWMQALGPIENPDEHDFSRSEIAKLIAVDDYYKKTYTELFGEIPDFSDYNRFPDPAMPSKDNLEANRNWQSMSPQDRMEVNKVFANVGKALAAFQMTLISQKNNFDVFVEGIKENNEKKKQALSLKAKRGLKVFLGKGQCIECHHGPAFTDSKFHNTLLPKIDVELGFNAGRHGGIQDLKNSIFNAAGPFSDAPKSTTAKRLSNLKAQKNDIDGFKTPGLRNVYYTHPFMHTGQFRDLKEVIEFYSEMKGAQKSDHPKIEPRHFSQNEKSDLLEFLKSLSSYYR